MISGQTPSDDAPHIESSSTYFTKSRCDSSMTLVKPPRKGGAVTESTYHGLTH